MQYQPKQSIALNHGFVHRKPPEYWFLGFPLGNGFNGVMLWGDGHPLNLTLDCTDVWDLRMNYAWTKHPNYNYAGFQRLVSERRFDEVNEIGNRGCRDNPVTFPGDSPPAGWKGTAGATKLGLGRMEFALGKAEKYEVGLNLETAMVAGSIRTARAVHRLACFVHHDRKLICLRITNKKWRLNDLRFRPLSELSADCARLNHPAPVWRQDGNVKMLLQRIPEGQCYAVAWQMRGSDWFVAMDTADAPEQAAEKVKTSLGQAERAGFDKLCREHERAWRDFWRVSAVYLPEPEIEFFWRYSLYLLAAAAPRGLYPILFDGVCGNDGALPPWRGYVCADLEMEILNWPAFVSGHLELADLWLNYMKACIEPAREFTRNFFGTEGTCWPGSTKAKFIVPPSGHGWTPTQFAWSHSGFLVSLAWLRWRHSMDTDWLADTGYPLVAEVFKFYRSNLKLEPDGFLHVPLSSSPEYGENTPKAWAKDPNIDIALIRRCCDWLVEMEAALGIKRLTGAARKVHSKLVPYALTEKNVLCLWPGKSLDKSYRHPSHLMAIHPAMDMTIDGDDKTRAIIDASVKHYLSLGQWNWGYHTYGQLVSFAAVLGRGEWAYENLRQIRNSMMPNGLHTCPFWRDTGTGGLGWGGKKYAEFISIEAVCAAGAGISDMLLQGWNDVVRVFPAIPEHWRDVAFRDLVTEGAFRVSAVRQDGRTVWVKVRASKPRKLRLRNPFESKAIMVKCGACRRQGDFWTASLKAGQEITLQLKNYRFSERQMIKKIRGSDCALIGLR